jgi:hypothetical protein
MEQVLASYLDQALLDSSIVGWFGDGPLHLHRTVIILAPVAGTDREGWGGEC